MLVGPQLSASAEHSIGPDLAYPGLIGLLCAGSALAQARALKPHIVLMDVELPGEDGVVTTQRLKSELPDVIVVMLTVQDDSETLFKAIKAGAQAT